MDGSRVLAFWIGAYAGSVKQVILCVVLGATACGTHDPCTQWRNGGTVCWIDAGMAADTALALQIVDDDCGSACRREPATCEITRSGAVLTFALTGRFCPPTAESFSTVCIRVCVPNIATCITPPLPAGEYTVRSQGQPDHQLSVGTGTAISCSSAGES